MALKDFAFAHHTIETSNGSLTVRGLHTADVIALFRKYENEIIAAAPSLMKGDGADVEKIAATLILSAPALVAAVISRACGEPDNELEALALPLGVQVEALNKIAELTFTVQGGIENFIKAVKALMQQFTVMSSASSTGIGESDRGQTS